MEVSLFAIVFAFAGVLIGSAVAQALSSIVAHHLAAVETSTTASFTASQAQSEASTYLLAKSTIITNSRSQCSSSTNACVVFEPCSATQPACVVVVERSVLLPVVNTPITWIAKAVSIWQPGTATPL